MKSYSIFLLVTVFGCTAYGQSSPIDTGTKPKKVYVAVEIEPAFPGGPDAFLRLTQNRLKYPVIARLAKVTGKVNVKFTVGKDGLIKNAHALDTIGFGCEEAAVIAVSSTIKWHPGLQNGTPVDVNFTVPITFSAPEDKNDKFDLSELSTSDYAFIFEIKGIIYPIDDAVGVLKTTIIAKSQIISVLPYADKQKYPHPGKKRYLPGESKELAITYELISSWLENAALGKYMAFVCVI